MRIRIQHHSSIAARLFVGAAIFGSIATITGCSGTMMTAGNLPAAAGTSLHGTAKGGQQPLTGARIYLFAAGATGYASASPSLLNTAIPAVSTDLSGNGYVLTDTTGSFTITGDWTCAHASDQVYVLATGGNPGLAPGTNNSAIVLMDALGTCSTLSSSTFIVVNELSTVAAVTALQQFMTDGTHVGSSATNPTGLANAFASATNMVDIAAVSARTTTPAGNGDVPQTKLHSLANILATCVNTSAATSAECATLFTAATPSGGTAPANSLPQSQQQRDHHLRHLHAHPSVPALTLRSAPQLDLRGHLLPRRNTPSRLLRHRRSRRCVDYQPGLGEDSLSHRYRLHHQDRSHGCCALGSNRLHRRRRASAGRPGHRRYR